MVAAVATEDPDTAANPAQAPIVAIPRPPGNFRNHLSNVLYKSLVIPELPAKPPITMKRGITVYG